ncbi:MAG: hypothetical protein WCE90_09905 [Candidatus Zixiibacteriota bacterium]
MQLPPEKHDPRFLAGRQSQRLHPLQSMQSTSLIALHDQYSVVRDQAEPLNPRFGFFYFYLPRSTFLPSFKESIQIILLISHDWSFMPGLKIYPFPKE